jgi:hypothetical protein
MPNKALVFRGISRVLVKSERAAACDHLLAEDQAI